MLREKFDELNHKNKRLVLVIEVMLVVIFIILLAFLRRAYDARNVDHYYDPGDQPVASAENGVLSFNTVSVTVPAEGAHYAIGYDQATDDEEYPSVASSASAYYKDEEGKDLYEVALYRDRVIPKATDHDTYTLNDWFAEWQPSGKKSVQESYNTPQTAGFLIRSNKNCSFTYYFPVETESTIEQYVLELDYYDTETADKAEELFKTISESISVKKPVS